MLWARAKQRERVFEEHRVLLAWMLAPILSSLYREDVPMWKILGQPNPEAVEAAKDSENMLDDLAQEYGLRRAGV